MQCPSCGTTIPPGARFCPTCGRRIPDQEALQETVSPAPAPEPQIDQTATLPDQPNSPASQQAAPSAPSWQTESMVADPQPRPAPPPGLQAGRIAPSEQYYAGPGPTSDPYRQAEQRQVVLPPSTPPPQQQPFYGSGQQAEQKQAISIPSTPPPQQQRRRGLSRGMTILLAALALLLILVGAGLIYYANVYHPAQLHAQATATAQTMQTRAAQATSTSIAQATGTAIAEANATATANAQATAFVVATQTALQNIYTSATTGTPALNDPLTANSGSNWDEDLAQGGGGCSFVGGAYHASLFAKGYYFPCFAENTNFKNFAFQIQMTIVNGDAGGLLFRANSSATKFYAFQIASDGSYFLILVQGPSQNTTLLAGNSPVIKQHSGQNLVTVIARGSTIYLYVNKQYIGSATDSTYTSGQIGVFAVDHSNPTDVAYSNAQVWNL